MTEPTPLNWHAKHDDAGKAIPNCWSHSAGYTISMTGRPSPLRYAVTRSGDINPFAYLGSPDEVEGIISVDLQYSSKPLTMDEFQHLEIPA